jgi:hypothetical protein
VDGRKTTAFFDGKLNALENHVFYVPDLVLNVENVELWFNEQKKED